MTADYQRAPYTLSRPAPAAPTRGPICFHCGNPVVTEPGPPHCIVCGRLALLAAFPAEDEAPAAPTPEQCRCGYAHNEHGYIAAPVVPPHPAPDPHLALLEDALFHATTRPGEHSIEECTHPGCDLAARIRAALRETPVPAPDPLAGLLREALGWLSPRSDLFVRICAALPPIAVLAQARTCFTVGCDSPATVETFAGHFCACHHEMRGIVAERDTARDLLRDALVFVVDWYEAKNRGMDWANGGPPKAISNAGRLIPRIRAALAAHEGTGGVE